MNRPEEALRILTGHVDMFAVTTVAGRASGARRHLFRVEPGAVVFGLPVLETGAERLHFLAVGGLDTEAEVLPRQHADAVAGATAWVSSLARLIVGDRPRWDVREAALDAPEDVPPGDERRGPVREVAWLRVLDGSFRLMGEAPEYEPGGPPVPLAAGLWCSAGPGGCRIAPVPPPDASAIGPTLDAFHAAALVRVRTMLEADGTRDEDRLAHRITNADEKRIQLFEDLAAIVVPRQSLVPDRDASDAVAACRAVAGANGAAIVAPHETALSGLSGFAAVLEIARASRLRVRQTLLRGEWWRHDAGPLVGWLGEDRRTVALLPTGRGRYALADPLDGQDRIVDAALAAELAPEAVAFYPALSPRPLRLADLLRFAFAQSRGSYRRLFLTVGLLGLSSWVVPLVTQVVVTSAIPRTELDQLTFCALALAVTAVAVAGVQALESTAILRIEGLVDWRLQSAIIDRVLRLPASVFRDYTVGDFVDRALGVDAARRVLTGSTLRGLLSGLFCWFSVALLFTYDARLASVALGLVALRGVAIVGTSVLRLRHETVYRNLQGRTDGLVLQIIGGIGKLRIAAATSRALAVWGGLFAAQKRRFISAQRLAMGLAVFDGSFTPAATLVVFAVAAGSGSALLADLGAFLAFFAAFGQAMGSIGHLTTGLSEALTAVPSLTRIRPIISAAVELSEDRKPPGPLSGAVELSRVTFRYASEGPPILDNVSLRIAPGEYVAIVGPSGSGKSSLFRLLLGFETVEAGVIFYDGKSIDTLDVGALRRQLGVVLQNGRLMTGSIYHNICGGLPLELEQVWEAARLASLEADIRAMPMGLHTMVSEGVSTISGGQRQRIMIARAIARRPRILLLDEATSSLDNRSQAVVSEALGNLAVTRIVIAHRLSTVRDADRIVVLSAGRIVESGTFDELSRANGLFADFARRQLV